MTEEKKQDATGSSGRKVGKATTGAWWKSVSSLLKKEKTASDADGGTGKKRQKTAETPEPEREETSKKQGSQGKRSEKKTGGAEGGGGEKKDREKPEGESSKEKTGSRSRGRSRKSSRQQKQNRAGEQQKKEPESGETPPRKTGRLKLLINAEEPEECRIALVEDGRLQSFQVTTVVRERTKNNIYKGRIVAVEANLQAAFVDIGTGRNGFLPFN